MPTQGRPETRVRRFWAKIRTDDTEARPGLGPCWNWAGALVEGYGQIDGIGAHRVSWEIHFGAIPEGQWVLHRCDNPRCCNPAHLFLGTSKENVADMVAKSRHSRGEAHSVRLRTERRPRGETVAGSRLTEADVPAIREAAAAGETQEALAARYGVAQPTIGRLLRGETWRHV